MVDLRPSVLLISNRDDFATDFIASKLKDLNRQYFRLNSEDIDKLRFQITPREQNLLFSDNLSIDLNSVRSVFFRRSPTVFAQPASVEEASFINRERRDFLEGLFLTLEARWINPLSATILGERKLHQLHLAKSIGLQTPKTLITNDSRLALEFVAGVEKAIVKPLSFGLFYADGRPYSIYTNELTANNLSPASFPMEAPLLLQEKIESVADIRATIVGEELFSVRIVKERGSQVDWRRPDVRKTYEVHSLPSDLSAALVKLNRTMGLVYSAADLMLKPNGEYVFLETNPVGEWLWLELELGLRISDKIVQLLFAEGDSHELDRGVPDPAD